MPFLPIKPIKDCKSVSLTFMGILSLFFALSRDFANKVVLFKSNSFICLFWVKLKTSKMSSALSVNIAPSFIS